MYQNIRRFLALLLALVLTVSACGKPATQEENPFDQPQSRGTTDYEQEYIRQHLEFIAGEDYATILSDAGGLAAAAGKVHQDAKLNIVNGAWGILDKVSTFLDGEEVELVNEYEIPITQLMLSTNSRANFADTFQSSYYEAIVSLLSGVTGVLKQAKEASGFFTGDSLDDVEEVTQKLDGILVAIQQMQGVAKDQAQPLFEDAMKAVKETFEESYIKENEKLLKKFKGGLSTALDITELTSSTLTDAVDEYILRKSLTSACEEWEAVWFSIGVKARVSENPEGAKVADCIDKILQRTQDARESEINALVGSFTTGVGQNLTEFTLQLGGKFLTDLASKNPIGKAIIDGIIAGTGAANALTNMDDIAYYGRMVVGYGVLAENAWKVMQSTGESLGSSKSYADALLFDQAFQVYKQIQLSAILCAINYCNAIVVNPLGYTFKYTVDDEIAEILLLNVESITWERYFCHGAIAIYNNGGNVVGYNQDIYYFRTNPASLETSATYGVFGTDKSVASPLVRRSADGKESVLLEAAAESAIYICNNYIYYRKYDGGWYRADLSKPEEMFFSDGDIIGYLEKQDMLVMRGDNGNIYATNGITKQMDITDETFNPIAVKDDFFYHYRSGNGRYSFYRWNAVTGAMQELGTVSIPPMANAGTSLSSLCVGSDGIYFLAGYYAGTGFFFQGGNIYFLSFETGAITTLVEWDVSYDTIYVAEEEDGARYLYYYNAGDVLGVGLYTGCMSKDVTRIDLNTGAAETVTFPLAAKGDPFIYEGNLMLLDGTNTPVTVLGPEALAAMGLDALGYRQDGSAVYHTAVDEVNGVYYVTLMDVSEDNSASVGWRQGYSRNWARLYSWDPATGKAVQIHGY